ncbi:hypothetical protein BD311DRAFT_91619 [Dichomitus squalens]|uniref:Secreted protein n=1 Tax=Dichomitus squalens TaxID=114155 RepID=A0A4Q9MBD5_9APHY|nr:hypothetical protein BD311DRAFT_91619 [Dichomitus squalens]
MTIAFCLSLLGPLTVAHPPRRRSVVIHKSSLSRHYCACPRCTIAYVREILPHTKDELCTACLHPDPCNFWFIQQWLARPSVVKKSMEADARQAVVALCSCHARAEVKAKPTPVRRLSRHTSRSRATQVFISLLDQLFGRTECSSTYTSYSSSWKVFRAVHQVVHVLMNTREHAVLVMLLYNACHE